jgi:translation initiation factor 2B subunit (eIF-2B alpha/beta/delta family)
VSPVLEPAAFERWSRDHSSGAATLTAQGAALLAEGLERCGPEGLAALPGAMRQCGAAHPAFGSLWRLLDRAARVLEKAGREDASPADTLELVRGALRSFAADLVAAGAQVAEAGAGLVPEGALVAVYSRSAAVEGALVGARRQGRRFTVLLSEARPALEGLDLARALCAEGIPCVLTADAMLPMLLARARLLLLGADAATPNGLVHKAGTYPLLLAARELNVPAYALAARAKFIDPLPGTLTLALHPPEEILADSPPGLTAVNAPFEESPFELVRGVVTESAFLGASEAAGAARMARLHESLRA